MPRMTGNAGGASGTLPADVEEGLARLVESARTALGDALEAVVLYGSAAEGRLRATSDVNLIFVLRRFDPSAAEALREPLRSARASIAATAMFLLSTEVADAAAAFAVKFADVLRRRRVLWGNDPFARLEVPRQARLVRLRQELLNQTLRLRERFVSVGLREEQLARALADAAGPLRAAAATLLELEGAPAGSPKEALERVAKELGDGKAGEALAAMSQAREQTVLPPGQAAPALVAMMAITERLRDRAARLA